MSSNKETIFKRYEGNREDRRAEWSRAESLEFYYTKKHIDEYITKDSRVLEVGCATGYYGLYYADKCREYMGIDIFPPHIEMFKQKINNNKLTNVSCEVGDATNLTQIADCSFDAVLCLGPMYHLPPDERELVFAECSRVCKKGGILAFAYINAVGAYTGVCVCDDVKHFYPNTKANEFVLQKMTDDEYPGLFYYTMPEEMEAVAKKYELIKIKNLGTAFRVTMKIVNDMNNEQFEIMKPLYDQMTAYESCTGMSEHALLVCKNKPEFSYII